jgi:hypothetical protein
VALAAWAHAWLIPELYAQRGANVIRPKKRDVKADAPEQTALGLLADLVGLRWTLAGMGAGVVVVITLYAVAGRRRATRAHA